MTAKTRPRSVHLPHTVFFLTINVHITPLTTAIEVTLSTQNNIINFLLGLVGTIESRTKAPPVLRLASSSFGMMGSVWI